MLKSNLKLKPPTFRGMGTLQNPYRIDNEIQLVLLATLVNAGNSTFMSAVYKQTKNLDLTALSWTPIGNLTYKFSGIYDGDGWKISNLSIPSNLTYAGLFGYAQNAMFRYIGLESGTIRGQFAGGICGYAAGSVFSQCYNKASVLGTATGNVTTSTGGIVGNGVTCVNCANYGAVNQQNAGTGTRRAAGINSNSAAATATTTCFNSGNVISTSIARAIATAAIDCFYDSSAMSSPGGITAVTGATGLNNAQCTGTNAAANMTGFDFVNTWMTNTGAYPTLRIFNK